MEELMRISSNFIWKNPELALNGDENVSSIEVEQYILAVRGTLTFELIHKFDIDVLTKFGFTEDEAKRIQYSPYTIPESLRPAIEAAQIEYIQKNYKEKNNYYRMLNGLPDLEDTDFIFNTKYPDISDAGTPIHLLDMNKVHQLDRIGFIDEMKKKYPEKKYLNHLTDKKISIYNARNAPDYGLLWITESEYENLLSDFTNTYNQCRQMVVSVYYQKDLYKSNSEYTGFLGMTILFATIMQMFRNCLTTDITRDFYDNDSLRYIYDSYGVPYYDTLPLEYHKRIVKNINLLIRCKGSPEVFFKIFDIFGFGTTELFAYYILKTHRFENGKPIFPRDEEGNLDLRAMYEIKFAKVKLWDSPSLEVKDPQNWSTYEDMTGGDPYWINDEHLLNKIYTEEYNYRESKYFGIQTTFNIMKIIYESTYYLKMILDNRDLLPYTKIYNSTLQQDVTLFDMIIYLTAIIIRKYGYRGDIPSDPHVIGKFMGFNFQEDLSILKENITENDYLKNDKELLDLLTMTPVNSLSAIKNVYGKITQLRSYIINKMFETDDPGVYHAYSELYNMIMYSEYTKETFVKSDGTQAATFEELLADINPQLYNRYMDQDLDEDMEITSGLFFLENSCSLLNQIQFLSLPNSNFLLENIFKLLDYFKSTKTDLTGYHIIYSLVSNYDNYVKLMNVITFINDDHRSDPLETIFDQLTDVIAYIRDKMYLYSKYFLKDDLFISDFTILPMMKYELEDYLTKSAEILYGLMEDISFKEELMMREIFVLPMDELGFSDCVHLLYDEICEIIKEYKHVLFPLYDDLVNIADHFLPMESRNLFVSRIMCFEVIKGILHSDYHLKDEISLTRDVTIDESRFLLKFILKSIVDLYFPFDDTYLEDIITFCKDKLDRRYVDYTLSMKFVDYKEAFILESKFLLKDLISYCIEKEGARNSEYTLEDETFVVFSKQLWDSEFYLSDLISFCLEKISNLDNNEFYHMKGTIPNLLDFFILHYKEEKLNLSDLIAYCIEKEGVRNSEYVLEDEIEHVKDITDSKKNKSIISFIDDWMDKYIQEIILTQNKKHEIHFMDSISTSLTKLIFQSSYLLTDKINSERGMFSPMNDDFSFLIQVLPEIDTPFVTSSAQMEDDLVLVFERKEED